MAPEQSWRPSRPPRPGSSRPGPVFSFPAGAELGADAIAAPGEELRACGDGRWRYEVHDAAAGAEILARIYAVRRLRIIEDDPFDLLLGVRAVEGLSLERFRLPGVVADAVTDGDGVLRIAQVLGGRLAFSEDHRVVSGPGPWLLPLGPYTPRWEDLDLLTTTLDLGAVQRHAAGLLGVDELKLRFSSASPVSPAMGEHLARAVLSAGRDELGNDEAMAQPLVRAELFRHLATAVLHTFPGTFLDRPDGASEHRAVPAAVRRAVAYMEEHLAEPIGLAEIAAAARLSPRGLQAAFRRALDTTPLAHLRLLRLEAAHVELLSADPSTSTVAGIAARWGFAHPGRFAAVYRERYGHGPAESLYF
ncbi:helix-turn-helix transcriptional regulator [Kocuria flava]|uniref:helix-turn-helix domain-containing protein n=1 Tax=Kocuria flava TaxID=446860 RepID=UPI001FF6CDD7|nr:helix-turn-helix domain-containing protein [Kocuria flava]MCJ8504309.1 helix-turn-helix transcriptional regulator [Kocuria flava]MCJ8504364.1 helix-turn-helix transcriptional regulator [Kocuria flava]